MLASVAKLQEIEGNENGSWLQCLSLSKLATPRSLQHTASPSIGQLRICSRWRRCLQHGQAVVLPEPAAQ